MKSSPLLTLHFVPFFVFLNIQRFISASNDIDNETLGRDGADLHHSSASESEPGESENITVDVIRTLLSDYGMNETCTLDASCPDVVIWSQ